MALIAIDYQRGARGRLQKGKHTGVYRGVSLLGECQSIEGRSKPKNSPRLPRLFSQAALAASANTGRNTNERQDWGQDRTVRSPIGTAVSCRAIDFKLTHYP